MKVASCRARMRPRHLEALHCRLPAPNGISGRWAVRRGKCLEPTVRPLPSYCRIRRISWPAVVLVTVSSVNIGVIWICCRSAYRGVHRCSVQDSTPKTVTFGCSTAWNHIAFMRIRFACTIAMTGSSQSLSADDGAWLPIKNDCSSAKPHGRVITRALYLSKVLCRHKEGVANRGLIFYRWPNNLLLYTKQYEKDKFRRFVPPRQSGRLYSGTKTKPDSCDPHRFLLYNCIRGSWNTRTFICCISII